MALSYKNDAEEDERLNPASDLNRAEKNAAFDREWDDPEYLAKDGKSGDLSGGVRKAEDSPTWENKTTPNSGPQKAKFTLKSLKKKTPILAIIISLFGGAVGVGFFGGSGLILVNITEVLHDKFNTSLGSLDNRSNKIIRLKTSSTTSGLCSNTASVLCKYTSLSKAEIDGYKQAGITLKDSAGNEITSENMTRGKVKPATYEFEGKSIPASAYPSEVASNASFRSAQQNALRYNAKYASVSGKVWNKISGIFKTSKAAPFDDTKTTTDAEKLAVVEDTTKNGSTIDTAPVKAGDADPTCSNPASCTDAEAEKINTNRANVSALASDPASTTKATSTVLEEVGDTTESVAKGGVNALKVTGVADQACGVYGAVKAVGFAAKTVRAAQLARYAMVFMTTASMIKAGTANSDDVAYLASTLTALYIYKDLKGNTTKKSATDTLAYKNAAFGDTGKLDTTANQFMAGGGLVGELSSVMGTVLSVIGGKANANRVCGVLGNPVVSAGSVIVGIAAWIFPVTAVAMTGKEVAQIGLGVATVAVEAILPGLLKDIVAGKLIDKTVVGAAAGDALVSGVGSIMSTNAAYGGNAPLTADQAVAYNDYQTEVASQYAEQDRLAYSPLDATNKNTFMGTIVTNLSQYSSSFSSMSSILTNSASLITNSANSIFSPTTKAASASDYETCQDDDYQDLGIATDLFCNPIRGIPPTYLNAAPDPDVLTEQLITSGDVDPTTGDPTSTFYKNFVNDCITRDPNTPLGDTPASSTDGTDNGSKCIITNQTTADYYIHYVDQRALDQMENGMDDSDTTPTTPNSDTSSTADATIDKAHLDESSVSIACATGTTDSGIAQGYYNGKEVDVRLCALPNTLDTNHSSKPALVNSRVSGAFLAMTTALYNSTASNREKRNGKLVVADSFRTEAEQVTAFKIYGSPRAAKPGYSNHQLGLAIDFQLPAGNSGATKVGDLVYDWLTANGKTYGFNKLSSEAWHWEPIK